MLGREQPQSPARNSKWKGWDMMTEQAAVKSIKPIRSAAGNFAGWRVVIEDDVRTVKYELFVADKARAQKLAEDKYLKDYGN